MRKALAVLLAATLTIGASASPASASLPPPPDGYHYLTVSQVEKAEIGHGIGPSSYTGYGRAQVNSWHSNGLTGSAFRASAVLGIGYYPPTVKPSSAPLATRTVTVTRVGTKVTYTDSSGRTLTTTSGVEWWNPASWNWSAIWGTIYSKIVACTTGVIKTLVSTVGTAFVLKAVVDRALLAIGPEGWAVLVVGSCISGILG
jgi:hypothetical protein